MLTMLARPRMCDVLSYFVALLAFAAAVVKYLATRTSGRPCTQARQYLILGLLLLAGALLLGAPLTLTLAMYYEATPNMTRLAGNASAMGAAYCVLALSTVAPGHDPQPQRRIAGHAVVYFLGVLAMAVLLDAANAGPAVEFVATHGDDPLIDLYLAIYAGYLSWGMITFHRLGRRYFHASSVTIIARAGFRVTQIGLCFGYVWILSQAVNVLALHTGWPISTPLTGIAILCSVCAGIVVLGVTFPEWVPLVLRTRMGWYLLRSVSWMRTVVALALVNLLWRPLIRTFPEVAVDMGDHDRAMMLYRRVIEIRDVQLRLAPYVHPDAQVVAALQSPMRPDHARSLALFEAAALATGLDAFRMHHRYPGEGPPAVNYVDHARITPYPFDEARHLAAVAVAFRFSRTIRIVRRALRPRPGQPTTRLKAWQS